MSGRLRALRPPLPRGTKPSVMSVMRMLRVAGPELAAAVPGWRMAVAGGE